MLWVEKRPTTAWNFDNNLKDFIRTWQLIRRALDHRPFNEKSESHQAFLRKLLVDLEGISGLVDVKEEIDKVKNNLQ